MRRRDRGRRRSGRFWSHRPARLRCASRRRRRSGHRKMRAQPADHLATDAFDPDQLVDGPEGASLSIDEDRRGLCRTDPGQQRQDLRRRRVQVHDTVDRLARLGGRAREENQTREETDEGGAGTHACLSARGWIQLPGRPPKKRTLPSILTRLLARGSAKRGLGTGRRRKGHAARGARGAADVSALTVVGTCADLGAEPRLTRPRRAQPFVETDLVGGAVVRRAVRAGVGQGLLWGTLRTQHRTSGAGATVRTGQTILILAERVAGLAEKLHREVAHAGRLARTGGLVAAQDRAVAAGLREIADASPARVAVGSRLAIVPDLPTAGGDRKRYRQQEGQ